MRVQRCRQLRVAVTQQMLGLSQADSGTSQGRGKRMPQGVDINLTPEFIDLVNASLLAERLKTIQRTAVAVDDGLPSRPKEDVLVGLGLSPVEDGVYLVKSK